METSNQARNHSPRLLLGATGSVASIKIPLLVKELSSFAEVKLVCTKASLHFFEAQGIERVDIFTDESEWSSWGSLGDPVLHIELRKWADIFLLAPLDANTLAKISNGICDNLLTCVARAWDFQKPILVAPAMNTAMYAHPITGKQLEILESWGIVVIPPVTKLLACGDYGSGALAPVEAIVETVLQHLEGTQK